MTEKTPAVEVAALSQMGNTFAERKAAREAVEAPAEKAVKSAENKSVESDESKSKRSSKK